MDFLTFEHVDGLLDSIEFIFGYHVMKYLTCDSSMISTRKYWHACLSSSAEPAVLTKLMLFLEVQWMVVR